MLHSRFPLRFLNFQAARVRGRRIPRRSSPPSVAAPRPLDASRVIAFTQAPCRHPPIINDEIVFIAVVYRGACASRGISDGLPLAITAIFLDGASFSRKTSPEILAAGRACIYVAFTASSWKPFNTPGERCPRDYRHANCEGFLSPR